MSDDDLDLEILMRESGDSADDAVDGGDEKVNRGSRKRGRNVGRNAQKLMDKKTPEEIFNQFDTDKSGYIDFDEFYVMVKELGMKMTEAKARKFFNNCDSDGSGEMDFEEFKMSLFSMDPVSGNTLGFAPNMLLTPKDAFDMFDDDKSGFLDEDEFADVLEYLGCNVSDEMQDKLFKKYDKDGSNQIDFDEFKACWLRCSNVESELRQRGISFSKYASKKTLRRLLAAALEKEEDVEEEAMAQAHEFKKHERVVLEKKRIFELAKIKAKEALALAMDTCGQVYVFGSGVRGQFGGEAYLKMFEGFPILQRLWVDRVRPEDRVLLDDEAPEKSQEHRGIRIKQSGKEALRLRKRAEKSMQSPRDSDSDDDDVWENPFKFTNTQSNTGVLWARGISQVTVGLNVAFALTYDGKIFCWGGAGQWYQETMDLVTGKLPRDRGHLTARTAQAMNMVGKAAELENTGNLYDKTIIDNTEDIAKGDAVKRVCEYYGVWEPAPSNALRLRHCIELMMPKIKQSELEFSLRLRKKKNKMKNKTKLDLVKLLSVDLEYEEEMNVKSPALYNMEKKMKYYEKKKKKSRMRELKRAYNAIWDDLYEQQLKNNSTTSNKGKAKEVSETAETEIQYNKYRNMVEDLRHDSVERYTPRGVNVEIPLSGFTSRGPVPSNIRASAGVKQVIAGSHHMALVHNSGSLYMWGEGAFGRLGFGEDSGLHARDSADHPTQLKALAGKRVQCVALGYAHSAAIIGKGNLMVWGSGVSGKLGLGEMAQEFECFCPMPTQCLLPKQRLAVQVSCGTAHTACVCQDGSVFVWGCGDCGRLGLGKPMKSMYYPTRVKALRGVRVVHVACGSAHTVLLSSIEYQFEGEGVNRIRVYTGGDVYVCGAAAVLKNLEPKFKRVDGLRDQVIREISAGYLHIACVSMEGEMFSWGTNIGGCCGHPVVVTFVPRPKLVRTMYVAPQNLALGLPTRQSSTYAGRLSSTCVNGDRNGWGESQCSHTQMDPQPWWEVDLGQLCILEDIVVWNRQDNPPDSSRRKDEFTGRLFPFWILVGQTEFRDDVGGRSFARGFKNATLKKKFTENRRKTVYELPPNSLARYVRVQAEKSTYLHLAEVEVNGIKGTRVGVSRVSSVKCGNNVTIALIRPQPNAVHIENAYKTAVRADARNSELLRNYSLFYDYYDKWGRGEKVEICTFCQGNKKCPICQLQQDFPLTEEDRIKIKTGNALGKRPDLEFIGKVVIGQKLVVPEFKPRIRKNPDSEACIVS